MPVFNELNPPTHPPTNLDRPADVHTKPHLNFKVWPKRFHHLRRRIELLKVVFVSVMQINTNLQKSGQGTVNHLLWANISHLVTSV
jgi:hypothetical protein